MSAKKTALLVMAKMALADGHLAGQEKDLLRPLLDDPEALDELLQEAQIVPLEGLLTRVDRYADRFFIALRAASMAQIDGHLAESEQAFYDNLLEHLKLREEDVKLIETSLQQLESIDPVEPDPRIGELFEQSSFS